MQTAIHRFRKPASSAETAPHAGRRQPLLLCALVMMVAMLSFYVHLLSEQVQRAEGLRQSQRIASNGRMFAAKARAIRVGQESAAR